MAKQTQFYMQLPVSSLLLITNSQRAMNDCGQSKVVWRQTKSKVYVTMKLTHGRQLLHQY